MNDNKKKIIKIVVLCLVLAVAITVILRSLFGRSDSTSKIIVQMLCKNEACGGAFEISSDKYKKLLMKKGVIGPSGPIGPMRGLKCPKCGQDSAYAAIKCEKCGNIFFSKDNVYNDFDDRCPKCGFSALEEKYQRRLNNK